MSSSVLELYEKLKPRLGEAETRALLEYVASSVEQRAVTKEDLQRTEMGLREGLHQLEQTLREEMHQIDQALRGEIQQVREEMRQIDQALRGEIQQVREEMRQMDQALRQELHHLDQKIEGAKVDFIKWSFVFWVGNLGALSAIMFTLLRVWGPH
jgi:predicted  nucleic acid-binding Zn-ribbon protein